MATFNEKKFLSQAGVGTLWTNVVNKINAVNAEQVAALEAEAARAAAAEAANAAAISAEEARAKAAEQANAAGIAANLAAINAILGLEDTDAADLNSIKDLVLWIEEHGTEAAEMASAIGALETKTVLGSDAEGNEYATVKAYVEAVVAAVNSGSTEALAKAVSDLTAAIATAKSEAAADATTKANAAEAAAKAYADGINTDLDARLDVLEADPVTKTAAEAYTDGECAKVYAAMVELTEAEINTICGVNA